MKNQSWRAWVLVVTSVVCSACAVPKQGVRTLVDLVLEVCEDKQDPSQADIADCFQRVQAEHAAKDSYKTKPILTR